MTCNPHPTFMIAAVKQRGEERRAEAERYRLAKTAQDDRGDGDRRRPWIDLLAVAAVALTLLTAGNAVAREGSAQTQHVFEEATHPLAEGDSAMIAVQKVREAAS